MFFLSLFKKFAGIFYFQEQLRTFEKGSFVISFWYFMKKTETFPKIFINHTELLIFYCIYGYLLFSYLYSLVYTDFLPTSVASSCLTYETISILVWFDLVLHLIEQVILQAVKDKNIELFFWRNHNKLIVISMLRLKNLLVIICWPLYIWL